MAVDEETSIFGMEQGCPVHGDEHMKECRMCGAEFCRVCFPKSTVCPECADPSDEDEEDADFDDVGNLNEVLDDDEDEKEEKDEEEIPPEDLVDEEDRRPF
jgi:hypothetical protein